MHISKDILMKGIGKIAYNTKNDIVGRITEITNDKKNKPNYIILSSDKLKGFGSKYFAIPLSNAFVKISRGGKMVLNINETDLVKAREIDFDKSPITRGGSLLKTIFQLINYHSPFKNRVQRKR